MLKILLNFWTKTADRGVSVALLDAVLLAFSAYLAYAVRLTIFMPSAIFLDLVKVICVFLPWTIAVFFLGGQYRTLWAQAGMEDYVRFVRLYILAALLFISTHYIWRFALLPRTSLVIMLFAGIILCGFLRISYRLAHLPTPVSRLNLKAVIVGAGDAGAILARELLRNGGELAPCGFIDDDPQKKSKQVAGLTVLGNTKDLPSLIHKLQIKVVLVAIPSANGQRIRTIYDMLAPLGVSVRVLPNLRELAGGEITVSRLRKIKLEDLLGREPVHIDVKKVSASLSGRSVLVTGAGGSIGSEIVRQVLQNDPREVILLGHGEHSICSLMESMEVMGKNDPSLSAKLLPIIADVADETAMRDIFKCRRPQVIYHAAAHKHVPLMEDNLREALRVNTLGTLNVARLAGEFRAERMVLISTDKAVKPSSVMGASKRAAEILLGETQRRFPETIFMAVRFGNVLGSRGSVVPKFERQIIGGGPVTITDPAMKRYFMLTSEAVSLVIEAGAVGEGNELFALDMGEPISIVEMAEILIRLHGYEPHKDIQITYTGVRKGEKLSEELFYDPAGVRLTKHPKIFASGLKVETNEDMAELLELSLKEPTLALSLLRKMVPEYEPGHLSPYL